MKTGTVSLLTALLVAGCTAPSVTYVPAANVAYPAKSEDSPLVADPALLAKRPFTTIGRLTVSGTNWGSHYSSVQSVSEKFRREALARGADGVVNVVTNSAPYAYTRDVPAYTMYEPVTTYHRGGFHGTSSSTTYSNYGGWSWGSGTFSGGYWGTSTANVPIYHPGYTKYYSGIIHSMSGDLIVLLDKDTYGNIGVLLDMRPQSIEGASIWQVQEGSAAHQAGLKPGDILTKVGDIELKDANDFFEDVQLKPGQSVEVSYRRGDDTLQTQLIPTKEYYGSPKQKGGDYGN